MRQLRKGLSSGGCLLNAHPSHVEEQFQGTPGLTQGHPAEVQRSPGLQPGLRGPEQCYFHQPRVREHSGSTSPSSPQPPNFLSHLPKELPSLLKQAVKKRPGGMMTAASQKGGERACCRPPPHSYQHGRKVDPSQPAPPHQAQGARSLGSSDATAQSWPVERMWKLSLQ